MIDFKMLAEQLRGNAGMIVPRLLPGGRLVGNEWTCADLSGGIGNSLKVNIQTGLWKDFAGTDGGNDLISLKAAIDRCSMLEAAKALQSDLGIIPSAHAIARPAPEEAPVKPPPGAHRPDFSGSSGNWCYRDLDGDVLFYIARYDTPDGGKNIVPFTWVGGAWKKKGWPAPRPLYGLQRLSDTSKGVLIVEGEKSADAADKLLGKHYHVVTWTGGAQAYGKTDWTPIYGRKVTIWPDADKPGMEAADGILKLLKEQCQSIKIINTDKSDGWDAADALQEGWDTKAVINWAKPLAVEMFQQPPVIEQPRVTVEQKPEPEKVVRTVDDMPEIDEGNQQLWTRLGIPQTKAGQPILNVHTVSLLMNALPEFKDMYWYDEFHMKCYTKMPMPRSQTVVDSSIREYSDVDNLFLLKFFQSKMGLHKITDDLLRKAVIMFCRMNTRNEVKEWMESLKWDGKERISDFFIDCYGTQRNAYTEAVGRNFWTGMVARVYSPGCTLQTMVVLEGGQGVFKSRSLRAIGGKWFAEVSVSVEKTDFYMVLQGNILLEIAELQAFSKADVTKIKSIISNEDDRYRAPYAMSPENHPRQSIFVGTTNECHWLRDHTGGRRFWPISCRVINLDKIIADREQLFAEAIVRYKSGADWYKTPKEKTEQEQEFRREVDEWQEVIEEYVARPGNPGYCTALEVAVNALNIEMKNVDLRTQRRITSILTVMGWEKGNKRFSGMNKRVWYPKMGGINDLFVEDLQEFGIEGVESDLQQAEPGSDG